MTTISDLAGHFEPQAIESVFVRTPVAALRYGAVNLAQGAFDYEPEAA